MRNGGKHTGRNERRANARYYREYRKTRPFSSITSLVATAIFAYFIGLPLLIGLTTSCFGKPGEILTNLIDLLPSAVCTAIWPFSSSMP